MTSQTLQQQLLPEIMKTSGIKNVILYDVTTRILPGVASAVVAFVTKRVQNRAKKLYSGVLQKSGIKEERKGTILLERDYKLVKESNDMFDAVLSIASDLPHARFVKRTANGIFIVETKDAIALNADISFAKLMTAETDGEVQKMVIEVFSFTKDIVQIRDYLTALEQEHAKNRGNKLGRQIYYFDEIAVQPMMRPAPAGGAAMVPDLSRSPPVLTFTMFPLQTNKSLNNIYGASVRKAVHRVNFFLANQGWYRDKGIPYTLGILLHGAPGCGKTSFIKGLAKDTNRHVVNIKLRECTTVQQINNIFYSHRVNVVRDGATSTFDIPVDRRIIVMEDIDCLSSIILDRALVESRPLEHSTEDCNRINLSVLLNILDGILETPGRIVVMTSNAPWKLDPALVRPGRIDVSIEFQKCSIQDIMDMVEGICDIKLDPKQAHGLLHRVWTPAEVTKVIFENLDDVARALEMFRSPPINDKARTSCDSSRTTRDGARTS
ncbi:Mitochondrial chaperone BCS1 [Tetrabaena socialis]|uniref:Mitochondrial chaperone BCS1 n=1 Tax=Tetrabaena socialis TaxID=47790 RepID=A0A2J7ZM24_9CHLO|nr:Mitochondrial chaperone BCS1 [Tetrabaena socialis]|eukprot:PNH01314.1 Mitochondrial chaperone BCS1 [Tetrabaena socialis]